jgi:osmoprotectant transport system permease protein
MSAWSTLLHERGPELLQKLLEHLLLTGISTTIAMVIGLAAGIALTRNKALQAPVMAAVNALQTIPSLAMLAFLLPLFGIGMLPALIALTLYALLPIMRNTLTGIQGLPEAVLEACAALGFTDQQRLWQVELPLALPTIMAGIRTATVISVGVATLAAFIGAGGLGDFIVRGLAVNNSKLVLLGAIPAAALALLLDRLLQGLELALRHGRHARRRSAGKTLTAATLTLLLVLSLSAALLWRSQDTASIRVASKNFTEQYILAELLAQMLETHTDLRVERKLNFGSINIVHNALLNDAVDVYPEYTGTAWRVILQRSSTLSAEQTLEQVRAAYQQRFDLRWLQPFGFNNSYAILVTEDLASRHDLHSISDLAALAPTLTMGFASEFYVRSDGYPALRNAYALNFSDTAEMDLGLLYQALHKGSIDVAAGNSTDGRIPAVHLRVLDDDHNFFPPYYAAPVLRGEVLRAHPEIVAVLNRLGGVIDTAAMQAMNRAVDQDQQSAYAVAFDFLQQQGLLQPPDAQ